MATPSIPLIAALPQFSGKQSAPDDIVTANPVYQALLAQTGGGQNVDQATAANPQYGTMLSQMGAGGMTPQQAMSMGPMFALLMSLQGGVK